MSDDRYWKYEVGDLVAANSETPMPGVGGSSDRTENEIKRRLVDTDTDDQFYYIETESGDRVHDHIYSNTVLDLNYEKVGEVDDDE